MRELTMTNEELNEKIYELQGWQHLPFPACPAWQRPTEKGVQSMFHPPAYSTDIAAAFALEDEIPEEEQLNYAHVLELVIANDIRMVDDWQLIHATARQRCLAGLAWKETQK